MHTIGRNASGREHLQDGRLLGLACIVFFICKVVWAIAPPVITGTPRLGDDALSYLWVGASSIQSPHYDSRAVEAARALAAEPAAADPVVQFQRDRTVMRLTGVSSSPWAVFTGALLSMGLSHRTTFAAMEVLTGLVLAIGAAALLARLFGARAGAFGLTLLAIAILPRQGLHYLVPSVLTLGLALSLYAMILGLRSSSAAMLAIGILTATIIAIHPIGKAYAAIGLALAVAAPVLTRRSLDLPVAASVFAGAIVGLGLQSMPGARPNASAGVERIDLAGALDNARAFWADLQHLVVHQPLLLLLAGVGVAILVRDRRMTAPICLTIALLIGAIGVASVIVLPGYEGELMARMLVALSVVFAGLAGVALAAFKRRPLIALAGLFFAVAAQTPATIDAFYWNLNGRTTLYDEAALRSDLRLTAANEKVLWLDADVLMMAAIIEGGFDRAMLSYAALEPKDVLSFDATWVAAAPPPRLNTRAAMRSREFSARFYGWSFSDHRDLLLAARGVSFDVAYMRFAGGAISDLGIAAFSTGQRCTTARLEPTGTQGWAAFTAPGCLGVNEIRLTPCPARRCRELRLVGLKLDAPSAGRVWPWGEPIVIAGTPRLEGLETSVVDFSLEALLRANNASDLSAPLKGARVARDASGVVWIRVPKRNAPS